MDTGETKKGMTYACQFNLFYNHMLLNAKLLRDLIHAGHYVACQEANLNRVILMYIKPNGDIQWTQPGHSIECSLNYWLNSRVYNDSEIQNKNRFTWEYTIVTPLPKLPQVWDTVEVLEICRKLPEFFLWNNDMKSMVWNKYKVKEIDSNLSMRIWNDWGSWWFNTHNVAKCESDWEIIEYNWSKYIKIA